MDIFIFDSLSRKKREFIPIDANKVRIYACGPTVYDYAHIGNARMAVVTDLLVRVLKKKYKNVLFVSSMFFLCLIMNSTNPNRQYQIDNIKSYHFY